MADSVVDTSAGGSLVENVTETITNEKIPSTPEGMIVAYGSLVIMAMLPIFFGAIRSVKHQKQKKVRKFCFYKTPNDVLFLL